MPGQALIDHGRLLQAMGHEVELLVEAARAVPHDVPVRMSPGWTVGEVVRHVGSVHRVVLGWLAEGRRPREWQRDPAPGQSVESYLREGFVDLSEVLEWHDPGERAATWWPADPTYGFWCRRMAHETTIHRVDVEDAAGFPPSAIDDDIALDGVDEALAVWFGHRLAMLGLSGTRESSVGVRTGGHSWIARAGSAETVAWRCSDAEARGAGAVVSASPVETYLWLWGRQRVGAVRVEGDEDAAGQLWALLRLATR
ncbi:maleylpyruvate isomerase family mycothiol-dependent enzyme [Prauserella cavernicola]|uniref:Maleylpyruvate isomerase family mycothiol-dependent enzyme n=1 Tax=Prauserella cavernicola TaxID=2800127 RepID=A0A934QTR4_9PSEU|nr:maleylpyruvate isomerase family mycothiol-dependent enzyme [Prauserella cavernicola]MBK1786152.1 maleylpyruvate isomerase family mycothiol-dependent enzyme [Prauserella cavernicola]